MPIELPRICLEAHPGSTIGNGPKGLASENAEGPVGDRLVAVPFSDVSQPLSDSCAHIRDSAMKVPSTPKWRCARAKAIENSLATAAPLRVKTTAAPTMLRCLCHNQYEIGLTANHVDPAASGDAVTGERRFSEYLTIC